MKCTLKRLFLVTLCLVTSSCQALFTEPSPNSANKQAQSDQVATAEAANNPPRRVGLLSITGEESLGEDGYQFLLPLSGEPPIALARKTIVNDWTFLDPKGAPVFAARFRDAGHFREGLAPVAVDGKYGFVNTSGELVVEPSFYSVEYTGFHESRCAVSNDKNERGFIDKTGDLVIAYSPKLAGVRQFEGGRIHYSDEGKEVFLGLDGQVVFSTSHKGPFRFGEDYWTFTKEGLVGFLDASGKEAIAAKYEDAMAFNEGFSAVKLDGSWGLIDSSGGVKVKPTYEDARSPREQHFAAKLKGKWGFVGLDGSPVSDFLYDDVGVLVGDVFPFQSGEKWGLVKLDGTQIVQAKYSELMPWGDSENYVFEEK